MTETTITKLDAAQRQLDCAIRLLLKDEDSLAVHTLAHAAYGILRDLYGKQHGMRRALDLILDRSEKLGKEFHEVPNFLKHADEDPDGFLTSHSAKSAYLTLALAIMLWEANGGQQTAYMVAFSQVHNPLLPGHKAEGALEFFQQRKHDPRLAEFHVVPGRPSDEDEALRAAVGNVLNRPSS